eukprot:3172363-Alexandrium_andersonii.AAC.1
MLVQELALAAEVVDDDRQPLRLLVVQAHGRGVAQPEALGVLHQALLQDGQVQLRVAQQDRLLVRCGP